MRRLKALGGTGDILPEESRRWQQIEESSRRILSLYGYQEIRTPLIEEAAVFLSSLGEAAEIVTKQMYLFADRGGRQVALRPEGTACVVRAFLEHGLDRTANLTRLYYVGPMFRAERPQAGRRRQFHQLGVEVFGSASPYQDVEVLLLLTRLLRAWNLTGWTLTLNSVGCRADRPKIIESVRKALGPHQSQLCPDCQERLAQNPLRILDCKEPQCRKLSEGIDLSAAICEHCRRHFEEVTKALETLRVPFQRDPHLVRGLDYYTKTAFEVIHGGLGAQKALVGGGRYDDLVELMGGGSTPAIGFAVGLERVLMAQEGVERQPVASDNSLKVFVATVAPSDIPESLSLGENLRNQGISSVVNVEERPLKRQLEQADKLGCPYVVIRGEEERAKKIVLLKDMEKRAQVEAPLDDWVDYLREWLKK